MSPANSFGWMTGGLDDLIRLAYESDGFDVMKAVREEIEARHFGEVPVGCAFVLPTPGTRYSHLIVAPTMRVPAFVPFSLNAYLAFRATLIATLRWNEAHPENPVERLCCPGLATGIGKMPPWRAARQMRAAWDAVTRLEVDRDLGRLMAGEAALRLL